MNQEILLELGRVVYINYGQYAGKIAVVVELLNRKKNYYRWPWARNSKISHI